jgi:hypothetical protein
MKTHLRETSLLLSGRSHYVDAQWEQALPPGGVKFIPQIDTSDLSVMEKIHFQLIN